MDQYPIFHLFNRSNDREILFREEQNYAFFTEKMNRQISKCATILGYCIMPNHFHLVLTPHDPVERDYECGKVYRRQPTAALSRGVAAWLMGFTKSYNRFYRMEGSRFVKLTKVTYHAYGLYSILQYCHYNPVRAGLVDHPTEWAYSSATEYAGLVDPEEAISDTELGRRLLRT